MKLLTWLIVPLVVMTYGSDSVRAQSQARTVQLTIDQTPESSFPGSPCLIRVSSTIQLKRLRGRLLGKEIYFNQETGRRSWFGLAGISLNAKPGQSYAVEVEGESESGKPATYCLSSIAASPGLCRNGKDGPSTTPSSTLCGAISPQARRLRRSMTTNPSTRPL
jgi:hypothetical protein